MICIAIDILKKNPPLFLICRWFWKVWNTNLDTNRGLRYRYGLIEKRTWIRVHTNYIYFHIPYFLQLSSSFKITNRKRYSEWIKKLQIRGVMLIKNVRKNYTGSFFSWMWVFGVNGGGCINWNAPHPHTFHSQGPHFDYHHQV